MRRIFYYYPKSMLKKAILFAPLLFLMWFIPWVLVFHLGGVVYFPYHEDGSSRYIRATGPALSKLGLDEAWTSQKDIPINCMAALIAAEDGKFLDHNGIDTESIKKALESNAKGKRIRGGSTITQQLVKNVFLNRDKTYFRKSREIIGALLLDLTMGKKNQLTWYLNVVEFGPDLYGIGPAAKLYFKKAPTKLSLNECASLASILRDPVKSSRFLKAKVKPYYLLRREQLILTTVHNAQLIKRLKSLD